ncbi:DUF6531 domain-containing protein [Micromonospora sp. LOL_015]|uniref:DUF6531 domain-containing protein n=1 Tax=Micromonospora sp. LOL_015 TaxID=3345416 RepID=UPI003A8A5119
MVSFNIPNDPNWQWAYDAILYTVGERFPKGDPPELKALSVELDAFGRDLLSTVAAIQALGAGLHGKLDGPAADAFAQFHRTITDPVPQGTRRALVASNIADQANQQIDYGQVQIVVAAFVIVLDIALAMASGFGASLVPAYLKIGQQITEKLLDKLENRLHQLIARLALESVEEGVQESAENVAAQGIVLAKDNKSGGFDWTDLGLSAAGGVTIGAFASGFQLVGGRYFPKLANTSHGKAGLGAGGETLGEFAFMAMLGAASGFNPLATAVSSAVGTYASHNAYKFGKAIGGDDKKTPDADSIAGPGDRKNLVERGSGAKGEAVGGGGGSEYGQDPSGKGGGLQTGSEKSAGGSTDPAAVGGSDGVDLPAGGAQLPLYSATPGQGGPSPEGAPPDQAELPPPESAPPPYDGALPGGAPTPYDEAPPPYDAATGHGQPTDDDLAPTPVGAGVGSPQGDQHPPAGSPASPTVPSGTAPPLVPGGAAAPEEGDSLASGQVPVAPNGGTIGGVDPSPDVVQPSGDQPGSVGQPDSQPAVTAPADDGRGGLPGFDTTPVGQPAHGVADSPPPLSPVAPLGPVPSAADIVVEAGPQSTGTQHDAARESPSSAHRGSRDVTHTDTPPAAAVVAPTVGSAGVIPRLDSTVPGLDGTVPGLDGTVPGLDSGVVAPAAATSSSTAPPPGVTAPVAPSTATTTSGSPGGAISSSAAAQSGPAGARTESPSTTGPALGTSGRPSPVPLAPLDTAVGPATQAALADTPAAPVDSSVASAHPSVPPAHPPAAVPGRTDRAAGHRPQSRSHTDPPEHGSAEQAAPAAHTESQSPSPQPQRPAAGPVADRVETSPPVVAVDGPAIEARSTPPAVAGTEAAVPAEADRAPESVAAYERGRGRSLRDVPPAVVVKSTAETLCVGDPIDVTTGRMILTETDMILPGLRLTRTHRSDYRWGRSFGPSWASTLDQRVVTDDRHAWFLAADGSILTYPLPAEGDEVLPVLGRPDRLRRLVGGGWALVTDGALLLFAPAGGDGAAMLSDVAAAGRRWHVVRDDTGAPVLLASSTGDQVELRTSGELVTGALFVPADGDDEVELPAFGYDERRRLVEVRNSSGDAVRLSYDEDGRIVRWDDRNGEWYTYVYDRAGRCVSTDGAGGHLRYAFEYLDGRTVVTDSLGGVHQYALNDRLQVVAEVDPLGGVTRSRWDAAYRLRERTDPLGRTTRFTYDDQGRLAATIRPDGSHHPAGDDEPPTDLVPGTELVRDGLGRIRLARRPDGTVTEFGWTAEGDLAWRATAHGSTQEWHYDGEGNLVETIDALGRSVRIEYGSFDLPTARIDEAGNRTEFSYDTELRLVAVTNPRGRVWRYTYDAAGRLVTETDYDGRTQRYAYDAAGQLTSRTNAAGETAHYRYDLLGRVVERRVGDLVTRLGYDADGYLAEVTSPDAVVRFERDDQGRVVAESINGRTVRTSYEGDEVVARTTPSGRASRWTMDADGLPVMLVTGGHVVRFGHDAAGREVSRTVDEVVALRQTYDVAGRLSAQHIADIAVRGFDYDGNDRVVGITDTLGDDLSFEADEVGRIRTVTAAGGARERYHYDVAGGLAGVGDGRWEFDGSMLLRSDDARFDYDDSGRLIARTDAGGTSRFVWDAEDRLVRVVTPGGDQWHYRYDGFGRRVAKQRLAGDGSVAEEVYFAWAGDLMVEQTDGADTISWDYWPDGSAPVTQTGGDQGVNTVVTDLIGTPTHLIEPGGQLRWWSRGDLWGRGGDPAGTPLRFPGQYHDVETGLHYNRFRYYDPATARYLSPDPLGLAGGPNPTAYVDDPLTIADPLGLMGCGVGKNKSSGSSSGSSRRSSRGSDSSSRDGGSHRRKRHSHSEPSHHPRHGRPPSNNELIGIPDSSLLPAEDPTDQVVDSPTSYSNSPSGSTYLDLRREPPPDINPNSRVGKAQKDWDEVRVRLAAYKRLQGNSRLQRRLAAFKEQVNYELSLQDDGYSSQQIFAASEKYFGSAYDRAKRFAEELAESYAFSVNSDWWVEHQDDRDFEKKLEEEVGRLKSNLALWGKLGPAVAERITKSAGQRILESTPGGVIFDNLMFGTSGYTDYPPILERMWEAFSHKLVDVSGGVIDAHVFRAVMVPSVLHDVELEALFELVKQGRIDGLRIVAWEFVSKGTIAKRHEYLIRNRSEYEAVPKLYKGKTTQSFDAQQNDLYQQFRYREAENNRKGLQFTIPNVTPNERRDSDYIYILSQLFEGTDADQRRRSILRADQNAESLIAHLTHFHTTFGQSPEIRDLNRKLMELQVAQQDEESSINDTSVGDITAGMSQARLDSDGSIYVPPTRQNTGTWADASDLSKPLGYFPNRSISENWEAFSEDYTFSQPAHPQRQDSMATSPKRHSWSRRRSSKDSSSSSRSSRSGSGSPGYHSSRGKSTSSYAAIQEEGYTQQNYTQQDYTQQDQPQDSNSQLTNYGTRYKQGDVTYDHRLPAATHPNATWTTSSSSDPYYGGAYAGPSFGDNSPHHTAKSTKETDCEGDPIDVTTGRMILTETDAEVPGLPLVRTYRSDYRWGRSFGPSWASPIDQRVIIDGEQVRYLASDGSILTYPLVGEGETALPTIGRAWPLRRLVGGGWLLTDPVSGRVSLFAPAVHGESLVSDITDGGLRWSIARDDDGTVTELHSSAGATIEISSSEGLVTALRLPDHDGLLVEASRYGYDQDRQLTEVINSSGDPERFEYADGRMVRWEDRNGEWYTYTYDDAGRCVDTDGKNGYLRYRFEYSDGRTVVTDSLGAVHTYELNDHLQVVAEIDGLGATTRSEWDHAYRLLTRTDPLGRTTRYEYDTEGRQTAVVRPDGSRSTTSHDEHGREIARTDFDGSTITREFDTDGRVLAEVDASGEVVRFDRPTDDGRGTAVQVGSAVVVRNAIRQVTSMTTGDGETHYRYDELGRTIGVRTGQGITRLGWTLEGELAWREHPDGSVEEFGYDAEGNLVEAVARDGRHTYYEYGAFDLVTARIDDDNRTEYAYDTELRLTTITDPQGRTWRYSYDPNGRLVEETDFDGRTQRYAWDAAGQLVEHTNAAGEVTHYTYDLLGRVIEQRTGESVTRLTYDPAGRIVAADDADSKIRLERDALGRVIAEAVNGHTVSSAYDEQVGAVTARTRPSGAVTQWSYDESGRPLLLAAGGQRLRFGYDGGREVSRSWDAGLSVEPPADDEAAADETREGDGPAEVRYTLDAAGRPSIRSEADGDWRLTWDHLDRLTTVTTPDGNHWRYRYDAFGRRIAKQRLDGDGTVLEETGFVWSGDLLVEQHHRDGTGQVTTTAWEYHPTLAYPVAQLTDGTVHAVVTGGADAPPELVGTDGRRLGDQPGTPVRLGGRYLDVETGLQYDGLRYYDPTTARYLPESRTAAAAVR